MDYWGGGGAKGMLAPPPKLLGGGPGPPGPPLPTLMHTPLKILKKLQANILTLGRNHKTVPHLCLPQHIALFLHVVAHMQRMRKA